MFVFLKARSLRSLTSNSVAKARMAETAASWRANLSASHTRIRIEWNNVSSVVDVAIMSVAISRDSPLLVFFKARSLRSLTYAGGLDLALPFINVVTIAIIGPPTPPTTPGIGHHKLQIIEYNMRDPINLDRVLHPVQDLAQHRPAVEGEEVDGQVLEAARRRLEPCRFQGFAE